MTQNTADFEMMVKIHIKDESEFLRLMEEYCARTAKTLDGCLEPSESNLIEHISISMVLDLHPEIWLIDRIYNYKTCNKPVLKLIEKIDAEIMPCMEGLNEGVRA